MESRTLLLTLHIVAVAAWLGADLLQYAIAPRLARDSAQAQLAWARVVAWLHERYYAAVALVILFSGILLVLDGDWSWSSDFIWVGVGAIIGGATLGGGGLRALAVKRVAALEAGDLTAAGDAARRSVPLAVVVTALPIVAVLAMVDKWGL